jgi:predicted DNA-binding transcriptional regulator AlpA
MPTHIEGVDYFSLDEVLSDLGITRQTFWRWRKEGNVPGGHRFRDRRVLFTATELRTIREFANRIEPIHPAGREQLGLFNGRK